MAILLDGNKTAEKIELNMKTQIEAFEETTGIKPGLAGIVVGDNPASASYVRRKRRRATAIGMFFEQLKLPESTSMAEIKERIDALNRDERVHGILVQLPLPDHLDPHDVIDLIAIEKDVDGLTTLNQGLLYRGKPCLMPCTPKGILRLLDEYDITTEGKNVVVVGRSELVGRPLATVLAGRSRNATVTVVHTRTRDVRQITKQADIVAIAAGKAQMLDASHFKQDVVIVDAGMNAIPSDKTKSGKRLVGDVDFESASKVASFITPVPGGVGPMTVCMLLENTFEAARLASGKA